MKKILLFLIIGLIIPFIFFTVSLKNINDYGETTDEKFDQNIGEYYYYQWKKKGYEGLSQRFIPLQRNYGPFFDTIVVASNDILYKKLNLITNPVASYHFPVIIISSLALYIVFLFGYFNWGIISGLLASLTLAFLPRFIGDSQNNLKDTPLMTFFAITLFLYFFAVKRNKTFLYLLAGIALGLAYSIKINTVIVLPILLLWYFIDNFKKIDFKKTISFFWKFFLSLAVAFITILVVWPYYRYHPSVRFVETYFTFKDHVWNEYILYLGQHYRGHEVPWHYPLIMFLVTTPIFYLIMILLGALFTLFIFRKDKKVFSSLVFIILWILFPPMIQVLSKAPMYDGIRHFLVVLPPLTLFIGFTTWKIGCYLYRKFSNAVFLIYSVCIFIAYINILIADIRFHPYQIVYFNQLTGGVKGAKGKFDLDYWGQSLKEAAEWINKNLPSGSKIWLTIPMAHHFPIDKNRFTLVDRYPDYKVSLIRGMLKTWDPEEDYLNPKRKPIYSIKVDGGEILQIFQYKKNN